MIKVKMINQVRLKKMSKRRMKIAIRRYFDFHFTEKFKGKELYNPVTPVMIKEELEARFDLLFGLPEPRPIHIKFELKLDECDGAA